MDLFRVRECTRSEDKKKRCGHLVFFHQGVRFKAKADGLSAGEDISRAMKIVHGTAVASGIKVEGYEEWLETAARAPDTETKSCGDRFVSCASEFRNRKVPKPKTIMERYGPGHAACGVCILCSMCSRCVQVACPMGRGLGCLGFRVRSFWFGGVRLGPAFGRGVPWPQNLREATCRSRSGKDGRWQGAVALTNETFLRKRGHPMNPSGATCRGFVSFFLDFVSQRHGMKRSGTLSSCGSPWLNLTQWVLQRSFAEEPSRPSFGFGGFGGFGGFSHV